jgi:hypothetical protein
MPEPTKPELLDLRNQLVDHVEHQADRPLPPELYQAFDGLINWAIWRIDRSLTREQIRYQRKYIVDKHRRRFIAQHGKTRGAQKYAYREAAKELTGPYAGSPRTMEEDYLFEQQHPSDDPRSVRYRETLERRAREADEKRARKG